MFKPKETIEKRIALAASRAAHYENYDKLIEDVMDSIDKLSDKYTYDELMEYAVAVKAAWDEEQDRKSWGKQIVNQVFKEDWPETRPVWNAPYPGVF